MKNWALVPLAALGAGHIANAANVNRAIENELFPHLRTCGVSTGSHGKIKEEVTLRWVYFYYAFILVTDMTCHMSAWYWWLKCYVDDMFGIGARCVEVMMLKVAKTVQSVTNMLTCQWQVVINILRHRRCCRQHFLDQTNNFKNAPENIVGTDLKLNWPRLKPKNPPTTLSSNKNIPFFANGRFKSNFHQCEVDAHF